MGANPELAGLVHAGAHTMYYFVPIYRQRATKFVVNCVHRVTNIVSELLHVLASPGSALGGARDATVLAHQVQVYAQLLSDMLTAQELLALFRVLATEDMLTQRMIRSEVGEQSDAGHVPTPWESHPRAAGG